MKYHKESVFWGQRRPFAWQVVYLAIRLFCFIAYMTIVFALFFKK